MKDLITKVLTGQIRLFLIPVAVWLSRHGYVGGDAQGQWLLDISTAIVVMAWSAYDWVQAHRDELLARALGKGTTKKELEQAKAQGAMVPLSTGSSETPVIVMKEKS